MYATPAARTPGPRMLERARQVDDARAGGEEGDGDPEPLRRPYGDPEAVSRQEERAHREQIAELLVGDGAERDVGVPHRSRLCDESRGIDVEVRLGIGVHDSRLRGELRNEGECGDDDVLEPGRSRRAERPGTGRDAPVVSRGVVAAACSATGLGTVLSCARGWSAPGPGGPGPVRPGSVRTARCGAPSGRGWTPLPGGELARLTGERPVQGVTPDSLLALHDAGYRAVVAARSGRAGCSTSAADRDSSRSGSSRLDRRVVGVDYSLDAVEHAATIHAGSGLSVARTDALRCASAAGSFDYVCSSHLIEHFERPAGHVEEMARVLKPSGQALILTPNAPADFENPFHIHLFDADELRSMLSRHFTDVWVGGLDATDVVKADFGARRERAAKVLSLDVFDLRHKMPRSWYVAGYTRVLPLAYRIMARSDTGGRERHHG